MNPAKGRGGVRHRNIQHMIAKAEEKRGNQVMIEGHFDDHPYDLLISFALGDDALIVVYEVCESRPAHEVDNLKKALAFQPRIDRIICVSDDIRLVEAVRKAAEKEIPEDELSRVDFKALKDVLA